MGVITPVVSVIIPAYNAEKYIMDAINSVRSQTFEDWELIVIDDCSTDSTCSVVESMALVDGRIRLVKNETNIGVAEARNYGLELCKGSYAAFLDSDDIWYPEKLEKQLEQIYKEDADIVFTSYDVIDADGNKTKSGYIVPEKVTYDELLKENVIGCSTVLMSKKIFGKHRFSAEFYHEDYVLWLDLLSVGIKAVGCPQILAAWRLLENSRSFNKRGAAMERWKIYRNHCKLPVIKSIALMCAYAKAALKKYI